MLAIIFPLHFLPEVYSLLSLCVVSLHLYKESQSSCTRKTTEIKTKEILHKLSGIV